MAKIPVHDLLALFQRMYREHWRYTWGHAKEGDVDCSGAYVYAYQQFHKTIAHGSNAIARNAVAELLPISEAEPGMAAFKYYPPGHPKWDLPKKYRKGGSAYNGDLNDYYHIGLVDDGGKYVLNAQGEKAGFTRTKISLWGAVGYLKAVDYGNLSASAEASPLSGETGKGVIPMQKMIVTSENGKTVNVRNKPDGKLLTRLAVGTEVLAGEDAKGWREIVFGDSGGYMMSKFLKPVQGAAETVLPGASGAEEENPLAFVKTLSTEAFSRLREARDQAFAAYETLKSIVGAS